MTKVNLAAALGLSFALASCGITPRYSPEASVKGAAPGPTSMFKMKFRDGGVGFCSGDASWGQYSVPQDADDQDASQKDIPKKDASKKDTPKPMTTTWVANNEGDMAFETTGRLPGDTTVLVRNYDNPQSARAFYVTSERWLEIDGDGAANQFRAAHTLAAGCNQAVGIAREQNLPIGKVFSTTENVNFIEISAERPVIGFLRPTYLVELVSR